MSEEKLYNTDYLRSLADKYDLSPSKKYGQNYLIDKSVIERILEVSELDQEDTIVEVGPGFGVLTLPLSKRVKKVISFEIEKRLTDYWSKKTINYSNVEVVWGDVLREFQTCRQAGRCQNTYKVVANLPYQITSKIIRTFLEAENPPEKMVIMVQKEVAERIVAAPGKMSLLSLSVQLYGAPKIAFVVPKSGFWPMPKVDSAVVVIDSIERNVGAQDIFRFAKAGFSQKRKQLWKNLVNVLGIDKERVVSSIEKVTGNRKSRAEELSVEDWKKLSTLLT